MSNLIMYLECNFCHLNYLDKKKIFFFYDLHLAQKKGEQFFLHVLLFTRDNITFDDN